MTYFIKANYVEKRLEKVWPLLDNANKALAICELENSQMKEIVRKFDETICEKISKTHLMVFRSQLTDEY